MVLDFEVTVLDDADPVAGDDAMEARMGPGVDRPGAATWSTGLAEFLADHGDHRDPGLRRTPGTAQRPFHCGARFSAKAVRPSEKSSVPNIFMMPSPEQLPADVVGLVGGLEHDLAALAHRQGGVLA